MKVFLKTSDINPVCCQLLGSFVVLLSRKLCLWDIGYLYFHFTTWLAQEGLSILCSCEDINVLTLPGCVPFAALQARQQMCHLDKWWMPPSALSPGDWELQGIGRMESCDWAQCMDLHIVSVHRFRTIYLQRFTKADNCSVISYLILLIWACQC